MKYRLFFFPACVVFNENPQRGFFLAHMILPLGWGCVSIFSCLGYLEFMLMISLDDLEGMLSDDISACVIVGCGTFVSCFYPCIDLLVISG